MNDQERKYTTKKCYECFTHIPLEATVCTSCKKKVGPVDSNGLAKKPLDWKSYLICLLAFSAFFAFIWRAFLR